MSATTIIHRVTRPSGASAGNIALAASPPSPERTHGPPEPAL